MGLSAAVARGMSAFGAPSMKVRVPAEAPTTPPDIGASMKEPAPEACTEWATEMLVVGSIVEVSMKRRSDLSVGRTLPSRIES
jgi:hypothetical protein